MNHLLYFLRQGMQRANIFAAVCARRKVANRSSCRVGYASNFNRRIVVVCVLWTFLYTVGPISDSDCCNGGLILSTATTAVLLGNRTFSYSQTKSRRSPSRLPHRINRV